MRSAPSAVAVRLTPDALHLEVLLSPAAMAMPLEALTALIREHSARLGVHLPLRPRDIAARLRSSPRGAWAVLLSGTSPTAPVDGRVELLVPVPVVTDRPRAVGGRHAVRADAPLARLRRGTSGKAGYDLLGRAIAPREPRAARLPGGPHTHAGADGALLLASCDGEVVLRNMVVQVVPMRVHDGDVTREHGPLVLDGSVFVTGSVREGACIDAGGDVYVAGAVDEARLTSRDGSIAVMGSVSGAPVRKAELRAGGDVACGNALHTVIEAGGDARLLVAARHSVIATAGNLYLQQTVERGLQDVSLRVQGGLLPSLEEAVELRDVPAPAGRQHFRVVTRLDGSVALHGAPPLTFQPCAIVDLSTSGARCQVPRGLLPGGAAPGAILQLKLSLPGSADELFIVARLSRRVAPGVIALAFLQMTGRDHDRLTQYCLRLFLERGQGQGAAAMRRERG